MKPLISIVCAAILVPGAALGKLEDCPQRGQFKGVELYSWQSARSDEWVFALLPGTNREKTEPEIRRENGCILSAGELALAFERLGQGEEIFWLQNETWQMRLPSHEVVENVQAAAKSRGLLLHVSATQ
jgi:hypothetical protein